jgi:hypothetical protein
VGQHRRDPVADLEQDDRGLRLLNI